ncbi:MAG: KH domain-containing protein [Candidatus Portnoybacteria bacterium]|nr:KH domain-containing protein [Candidatus Portnoybacteria bacterium]
MESNLKENLKTLVHDLLSRMDFEPRGPVQIDEGDFLTVNIESDEAGFLIGQGGETLEALQYLAKIMMAKKTGPECPHFIIDINNYRSARLRFLKEMALRVAQEVRDGKKEKILEAMSAFERRIIHLALKDQEGVIAESSGIGPDRRIIIRPVL